MGRFFGLFPKRGFLFEINGSLKAFFSFDNARLLEREVFITFGGGWMKGTIEEDPSVGLSVVVRLSGVKYEQVANSFSADHLVHV
jgi:hypothetical protein